MTRVTSLHITDQCQLASALRLGQLLRPLGSYSSEPWRIVIFIQVTSLTYMEQPVVATSAAALAGYGGTAGIALSPP